jgi:hypothetical protein
MDRILALGLALAGRSLHHHREDARQRAGNEGARTRKRRNEA